MTKLLRVGIIGASPHRGWAKESHVPAIQQVAGLELVAVVAHGQDRADTAARAFGAKKGYGSARDLFGDTEIDLVVVCVKVPDHQELVLGALAAGKHVYCEWPLGRDVAESTQLRDAATAAGVHVAIGLQARANPALLRAKQLLADGAIGRVLSARMYSGTIAFGPVMGEADRYLEDAANGATHLTIHGGHALDAAIVVLGGLADLTALTSIQYPDVELKETGSRYQRVIPDYLLVQSHLQAGGVVTTEVAGGRAANTTFRFEVVGERGLLTLDGAAPRGFQSGRLILTLNGLVQLIDEGELADLSDPAFNVGALYARLRDDIANGTSSTPDFDHAVRLTRLITAVTASAESGRRKRTDGWPLQ